MYDLPSLNGLRAFEATARRGSVKDAAAELYVTPGAVSQQLKVLEDALGLLLFRRHAGRLALSAAGATLYPVLRESFESIAAALQRLHVRESAGPLTVSVVPSFASKWLVPRLGRFRERHPQIDVRLSATLKLIDLTRDDVDVAIRLGTGNYPNLRSDLLFREPLFPVCSPKMAKGPPPLTRPEELSRHTLLHDDSYEGWQTWLRLQGVKGVDAQRGPVFDDSALTLQAAIEGQGVAMTRGELAAQDIAEGRLVRLFGVSIPYRSAYYLVSLPAVAEWPKVAAFRQWMQEEVVRYRSYHPAEGESLPQAQPSSTDAAQAEATEGARVERPRRRGSRAASKVGGKRADKGSAKRTSRGAKRAVKGSAKRTSRSARPLRRRLS